MLKENIKSSELSKHLDNNYSIAIVYADWCGQCDMTKVELNKIAESRSDVNVLTINIDDNQEFVLEKQIAGTPTLFFFKGNEEVDRHVGYLPQAELERKLN